jgi:hypothetical protein
MGVYYLEEQLRLLDFEPGKEGKYQNTGGVQ